MRKVSKIVIFQKTGKKLEIREIYITRFKKLKNILAENRLQLTCWHKLISFSF